MNNLQEHQFIAILICAILVMVVVLVFFGIFTVICKDFKRGPLKVAETKELINIPLSQNPSSCVKAYYAGEGSKRRQVLAFWWSEEGYIQMLYDKGKASEAARVFFEEELKAVAAQYITERIERDDYIIGWQAPNGEIGKSIRPMARSVAEEWIRDLNWRYPSYRYWLEKRSVEP